MSFTYTPEDIRTNALWVVATYEVSLDRATERVEWLAKRNWGARFHSDDGYITFTVAPDWDGSCFPRFKPTLAEVCEDTDADWWQ